MALFGDSQWQGGSVIAEYDGVWKSNFLYANWRQLARFTNASAVAIGYVVTDHALPKEDFVPCRSLRSILGLWPVAFMLLTTGCESDGQKRAEFDQGSTSLTGNVVFTASNLETDSTALCVLDLASRKIEYCSRSLGSLKSIYPQAYCWGQPQIATSMLTDTDGVLLLDPSTGATRSFFPAIHSSDPYLSRGSWGWRSFVSKDVEIAFADQERYLYVLRIILRTGHWPGIRSNMRELAQTLDSLDSLPDPYGGNPPHSDFGLLCKVDSLGRDSILFQTRYPDNQGLSVTSDGEFAVVSDGWHLQILSLRTNQELSAIVPAEYRLMAPSFSPSDSVMAVVAWRESGAKDGTAIFVAKAPDFTEFTKLIDLTKELCPYRIAWGPDDRTLLMTCYVYKLGRSPDEVDFVALDIPTLRYSVIERPYELEGKRISNLVTASPDAGFDWHY